MLEIDSQSHFNTFSKVVERAIAKYGHLKDEDMTVLQCKQVEELAKLERKFRKALIADPNGNAAYLSFVALILEDKKNILAARPFFRHCRPYFVSHVSKAIRDRNLSVLQRYHVNYHFINYVTKGIAFGPEVNEIVKRIQAARQKLVVMNIPLVISRAAIFWARVPKSHLSFMDLVEIGVEGLISAIDKYYGEYSKVYRSVIIGRCVGNLIENYSMDGTTILYSCNRGFKNIADFVAGDTVWGVTDTGEKVLNTVVALHDHGELPGVEIEFDDGYRVVTSEKHKFLTRNGQVSLAEILEQGEEVFCEPSCKDWRVDIHVQNAIFDEKRSGRTQKKMPDLSEAAHGIQDYWSKTRCGLEHKIRGVEEPVRSVIFEKESFVPTPRIVPNLYRSDECWKGTEFFNMDKGIPQSGSGWPCARSGSIQAVAKGQSERGRGTKEENFSETEEMVEGTPCRSRKDNSTVGAEEGGETGNVYQGASSERMDDYQNTMWGGQKTGGLCFTRPQDMDRGGWILALPGAFRKGNPYRKIEGGTFISTKQGCFVECGGHQEIRRYVDQIIGEMLFEKKEDGYLKTGLEGVAYSNAPLSSTGGLVCRRILRFRFVGTRRMYDLEVSHPKHNFLLPNGVVTSNSSTLLHFYPADKRKLYRANKFKSRHVHGDYEIEDLVKEVSQIEGNETSKEEIVDLMAASAVVSANVPVQIEDSDESKNVDSIAKYAAPEELRPDLQAEDNEANSLMVRAIASLPLIDRKLLRLKGLAIVLE